jgi:hypothetical protein
MFFIKSSEVIFVYVNKEKKSQFEKKNYFLSKLFPNLRISFTELQCDLESWKYQFEVS